MGKQLLIFCYWLRIELNRLTKNEEKETLFKIRELIIDNYIFKMGDFQTHFSKNHL